TQQRHRSACSGTHARDVCILVRCVHCVQSLPLARVTTAEQRRGSVMRAVLRSAAIAAMGVIAIAAAGAEDFPTRAIRVIVGPGPDIVPRLLGPKMTDQLGQQVIVEPKPGAGGVIAAQTVTAAQPNGYTLLQATASYTINTALQTSPLDL